MLDSLLKKTHTFSLVLTWAGGVLILLSAFMVTAEVAMRKLLNVSMGGADELSGYALGIATTFSLAYALFERAHIRVDALFNVMPKWLQGVANVLGLLLLMGFVLVVVTMVWSMVSDTLENGSRSITPMRVPLAYPQIPWLFGWMFFLFSGFLLLLVAIKRWLSGDTQGMNKLIGVKSLDEQIDDERV